MSPSEVLGVRISTCRVCGGTQFSPKQRHTLNTRCFLSHGLIRAEAVEAAGLRRWSCWHPWGSPQSVRGRTRWKNAPDSSHFDGLFWQVFHLFSKVLLRLGPNCYNSNFINTPRRWLSPVSLFFSLTITSWDSLKQITNTLLTRSLCLKLCFGDYPNICFFNLR